MSRLSAVGLCLVMAFLQGCGGERTSDRENPNLEVSGRLVLSHPLKTPVVVQFYDARGGMEAYVTATPPDGAFQIPGPPQGPGIAPGEYKVVVVDPKKEAGIPDAWQDFNSTPLKVTINQDTARNLQIKQ